MKIQQIDLTIRAIVAGYHDYAECGKTFEFNCHMLAAK